MKILFAGVIALSCALSLIGYVVLPDSIASHWNLAGEVNGYMGKFWWMALFPLLIAGIGLLFAVLPRIDPLGKNIQAFRKQYDETFLVVLLFLVYVHALVVGANLVPSLNVSLLILPAVGGLLVWIGHVLPKTKRNWFFGIRTPWTLSSDIVWEKTHIQGGRVFKVMGVLMFVGILNPKIGLFVFLGSVFLLVPWLFAYSYFVHKKEKRI